ncbi:MAG: histidinol-phosphate aminotransferase family protein [Desulfohalobiaceae bacterium]|nr:histidinol-phosphate aminotransferase family protein [Desulfohalobiaceae bacterium]
MRMSSKEREIVQSIQELSDQAGTHSPSISTITEKIPELNIEVDACFLSNPYATDLFSRQMHEDLIQSGRLREVLEFYPSQNQVVAEHLAGYLNVPKEKIFIGNGATEIIQGVIHNFTRRKIVINIPTFSPYYEFVPEGVEVVYNQLYHGEGFRFNLERYIEMIERENPDTLVLINPNNPSGCYIELADIEYLVNRLHWVDNIIIDESFIHFAFEGQSTDLVSATFLTEKFDNLVLMKSMSKDFGIAGIRAGYAVMDENKVNDLLENGYLWNLSGLAEYFFRLYVNPEFQKEYEKVRVRYLNETQQFFAELGKLQGLKAYPSKANFVLVELTNGMKAVDFTSGMLVKHGVYTRDCRDKIGLDGEFVRIASRSWEENRRIVKAARDVLKTGNTGLGLGRN